MTIYDGSLQFSGVAGVAGSTDSPTTGTQTSNNTIDLLNYRDIGIGDNSAMKISVQVITPFSGGTSLQVNVQSSPDNSTYTTAVSGPVIAEANLVQGALICSVDLPRPPGFALPRYWRLQYVSGVGTHTAGSVFSALVLDRADQLATTAGYPTVYPSSVVVNN